MVIYVQKPQPALLAERQPDHATELDQLGLGEVLVQPIPECIVGIEMPGDGLSIGKRRLLPAIVVGRGLEIDKVLHLVLDHSAGFRGLHRALIATVFALHRARDIEPAQLLDCVVENAVAENVAPGIGEKPEAGGHMRAHR